MMVPQDMNDALEICPRAKVIRAIVFYIYSPKLAGQLTDYQHDQWTPVQSQP